MIGIKPGDEIDLIKKLLSETQLRTELLDLNPKMISVIDNNDDFF